MTKQDEPPIEFIDAKFYEELQILINKHGIDTFTHTPDFILTKAIMMFIRNYRIILNENIAWHGWMKRQ